MIEVLDDYGMLTGEILPRDVVHEKELLHRIVLVAIIDSENRILLQHRANTKKLYPNTWDISIAAHVLAGEESIETALREANEEIGFQVDRNVQVRNFRFVSSFRQDMHPDGRTERHWYDLFALIKEGDETNLRFNDSEVDGAKWCSYTDIQILKEKGELFPRLGWINPIFKRINRL